MIRLHMLVEGETEEAFVDEVLGPALWPTNVYPDACRVSTSRHGSRIRRGGGHNYVRWRNDLLRWMKQDDHPDVWFTTMVDFYRLPQPFPGSDACRPIQDPRSRVECLEQHFTQDINHPRFIPYIQLHEFEALLWSDVSCFAAVYPGETTRIQQLAAERTPFQSVEEIDEDPQTSPSHRILRIFPRFDKVTAGVLIAIDIGLPKMCAASPHFKQWFDRLSGLK